MVGIGPEGQLPLLDSVPDPVELFLAYQERIVLRMHRPRGLDDIQGDVVAEFDNPEWPIGAGRREPEDVGEKVGGQVTILGLHEGVVQAYWHKSQGTFSRRHPAISGGPIARHATV